MLVEDSAYKNQAITACFQDQGSLQVTLVRGFQSAPFRGGGNINTDDSQQTILTSQVAFEHRIGSGKQNKIIVLFYETYKKNFQTAFDIFLSTPFPPVPAVTNLSYRSLSYTGKLFL